jgi:hypothetical protein
LVSFTVSAVESTMAEAFDFALLIVSNLLGVLTYVTTAQPQTRRAKTACAAVQQKRFTH